MIVRNTLASVSVFLACCTVTLVCSGQQPVTTVAVLDFINRRPVDGYDWLAKGLADMVMQARLERALPRHDRPARRAGRS